MSQTEYDWAVKVLESKSENKWSIGKRKVWKEG